MSLCVLGRGRVQEGRDRLLRALAGNDLSIAQRNASDAARSDSANEISTRPEHYFNLYFLAGTFRH
jgi:hypothetical protein